MKSPSHFASPLPPNFAQEVLDLEGSLDFDCSEQTVKRLMQLYTAAIEHYEAIEDLKHLHYQDRLHTLLARADVARTFRLPRASKQPASGSRSLNNSSDLSADRSAQQELSNHPQCYNPSSNASH